jgi:hypothetical protein
MARTACAMDFPALFSLVHILTARWQHCLAPKFKKERASRFEVGSIREHTLCQRPDISFI